MTDGHRQVAERTKGCLTVGTWRVGWWIVVTKGLGSGENLLEVDSVRTKEDDIGDRGVEFGKQRTDGGEFWSLRSNKNQKKTPFHCGVLGLVGLELKMKITMLFTTTTWYREFTNIFSHKRCPKIKMTPRPKLQSSDKGNNVSWATPTCFQAICSFRKQPIGAYILKFWTTWIQQLVLDKNEDTNSRSLFTEDFRIYRVCFKIYRVPLRRFPKSQKTDVDGKWAM